MTKILFFCIFNIVLLFTRFVSAKTHYILIDPGTNPQVNYYRFYNSILMGYEVLTHLKKDVSIFAKNGKWILSKQADETLSNYSLNDISPLIKKKKDILNNPLYPPIDHSALSLTDIFTKMKKMNIRTSDKVFIFISPHGMAPLNANEPATVRIPFWESYDSYGDFKQKLKHEFSSRIQFFIVTSACYGGAVHVLAELPNVCTLATVPYTSQSSAGNYQIHPFSKALWNSLLFSLKNSNSIPLTLGSLAQSSLSKDVANVSLGRISSAQYVDEVLNKSKNNTTTGSPVARWVRKLSKKIWQRKTPEYHFFYDQSPLKILHNDIFYPEKFTNIKKINNCIQNDFKQIKNKITKLESLNKKIFINSKINKHPIKDHFNDSFHYIKNYAESKLGLISHYFKEHELYLEQWKKHSIEKENTKELRKLTKTWKTMNDQAKKDLIELNYHLGMIFYSEKIGEFKKISTSSQWKEYQRRLSCEWTSF